MPQPTRPIIGMNLDLISATKTMQAHFRLNLGYVDAIVSAGGMPQPMPPFAKEKEIAAFLDRVDGFLLTGGLDLDPRRNGQSMHSAVRLLDPRREESDRILVRQIMERHMPVLGVGLGMQQLNV